MVYVLDPYSSGYTSYLPAAVQDFTPVVIDYRSAFQDELNNDVYYHAGSSTDAKPKYYLRISPPRSSRRGPEQYVADSITVPIRTDNTFRYRLAPSTYYHPYGRYIVEYYRRGCQIPIDTQEWVVPALPKLALYAFRYESDEEHLLFPMYVWRILSFNPTANFVNDFNRLAFVEANRPPYGAALQMTYEPAATLDQLLEYSLPNLKTVNRIRR